MAECEECGKKLGMLEGYRHPTMGKKHHLCNPCFNEVSESVASWREFVLANSFNVKTSSNNLKLNWKDIVPSGNVVREMINNLRSEKLISTEKQ